MSYDLAFHPAPGAPALTRDAFAEYFSQRPHVTVRDDQAWYQNEATGVYFSFCRREPDAGAEPDAEPDLSAASLTINLYRPSVFGLEAEPEIAAFVSAFGLLVDDPQIDGMGRGDYSAAGFLRGWNYSNSFACRAFSQIQGVGHTLPGAEIERCWRWNLGRDDRQERLGDEIFVPKIMLLLHEGEAKPAVAWTSGMPIALPPVELLVVGGVMPLPGEAPQPFALVPYAAARELLRLPALTTHRAAYHLLEEETSQEDLRSLVRHAALSPAAATLAPDQVIDRELFEEKS